MQLLGPLAKVVIRGLHTSFKVKTAAAIGSTDNETFQDPYQQASMNHQVNHHTDFSPSEKLDT